MLLEYFSQESGYEIVATVRDRIYLECAEKVLPQVQWAIASVDHINYTSNFDLVPECDWLINAIGITKPLIKDDNSDQIQRAIFINSVLPHVIGEIAQVKGARVLQIATDCVYSGLRGAYVETDPHDALDVYGKTKSLGECYLPNVNHLRCSIIGPEARDHKFLMDWFLGQPQGVSVNGFSNHLWNGVTTLHFAKICNGIIREKIELFHLAHIVPADMVTKAKMLQVFGKCFGRPDIRVEVTEAPMRMDRTLQTTNPAINGAIWEAAGYKTPPTIEEMIRELSVFKRHLPSKMP